jgi:hypothetical protein
MGRGQEENGLLLEGMMLLQMAVAISCILAISYVAFWACVILVYVVVWIFETISKLLK